VVGAGDAPDSTSGRAAEMQERAIELLHPGRTLTTISIWHMREETYRAALAQIIEALHREPAAAWFGSGQVSSSDGQHFYLGGEGETGGNVNARYGRDPIIKLYTLGSLRAVPCEGHHRHVRGGHPCSRWSRES
jgi:hypothetical protein